MIAQRPTVEAAGRHLPQRNRPGVRHDRVDSYHKKTERHSALAGASTHTAKENAMSELSRRSLIATAAALPALYVPAAAAASPASTCTLPPDLIERFVRVRAWYLDNRRREEEGRAEVHKRFQATTGVTHEELSELGDRVGYSDPH
jgi:hypothetical protein